MSETGTPGEGDPKRGTEAFSSTSPKMPPSPFSPPSQRWRRAQEHEQRFWEERGDVAQVLARRRPRYEKAFARVAELLPDQPVVVDVGSGPTCWARFLPGARVYVDPLMHSYAARWAKQLFEGFPVAAAGEALPLRTGSCDLAFSVNAIDHCADPEAVIRECRRILKPGGLIAIGVYAHPCLRAALRRLRETLGLASDAHPFSFTRDMLPRLMDRCGLEVLEVMDLGAASFRTRVGFFQRTEPLVLARTPKP
jgi:SAM-dependent methyltransferase